MLQLKRFVNSSIHTGCRQRWAARCALGVLLALLAGVAIAPPAMASRKNPTDPGEIEDRAAPVDRRVCTGGNPGNLCKHSDECSPGICETTNIFNITVALKFSASETELDLVEEVFTAGSELIFDLTDGQARFGQVTILNDAKGDGDFLIYEDTDGGCKSGLGTWGLSGHVTIPTNRLDDTSAPGCVAHEFMHLVFDALDEYQSRLENCGAEAGSAQCPDSPTGNFCLMDCNRESLCPGRIGTELCWGHAGDLGNHDADLVTEQSRCRDDLSCWSQIGHSWEKTMLVPANGPEEETPGFVAPVFLRPPSGARLVLVLDRSGSMDEEEPDRIERLQTAALDIVELAENGLELGIVSFSSETSDNPAAIEEKGIEALGSNRSAWTDAIDDLDEKLGGFTNIGAGLDLALEMIDGVVGPRPAFAAVILMTDGFNNRPEGNAGRDLEQKLDKLLQERIPVYVTCTGDAGSAQCARIAEVSQGFYLDSADSSLLAERFVTFHEEGTGRMSAARASSSLGDEAEQFTVKVEKGAAQAMFSVQWYDTGLDQTRVRITEPNNGPVHTPTVMPLGRYLRVVTPPHGDWIITVSKPLTPFNAQLIGESATDKRYIVRTYIENASISAEVYLRRKVVQPGQSFKVCSRPLQQIPLAGLSISGLVETPEGRQVAIELLDDGDFKGSGDEFADDGVYCAFFDDTTERGGYVFRIQIVAENAQVALGADEQPIGGPPAFVPENFTRFAEVSGTVDDATEVDLTGAWPFACIGEPITEQHANAQCGYVYEPISPFSILPVGGPAGREINNIGYRTADDLLYGLELGLDGNHQVVVIDGFGTVFGLGRPAGLPADVRFDAGDISPDGSTLYLGYLTELGQSLYSVDLTASPVLGAAVPIPLSGDTGTVHDLAYNRLDGKLYGGDSADGEIAVIGLGGSRTDYPVEGLPTGTAFGGAWFDGSGHLMLYRNSGAIYEIDLGALAAPAPEIVRVITGPGAERVDMALCHQDILGVAKQMFAAPTGLPRPVTIDIFLENLSGGTDLSNLTAHESLSQIFGTPGIDWQLVAVNSIPLGFANPLYDGHAVTELVNQSPLQTLAAGTTARVTIELDLLTHAALRPDGYFCNQVLALGQTEAGRWMGDLSTSGANADPDNNGVPSEHELSCFAAKPIFECDGQGRVTQGTDGQLDEVIVAANTFSLLPVGGPFGREINSIGLRRTDGLLYGLELTEDGNAQVVQIDAAGTVWGLGRPAGLPADQRFDAGDVSSDGETMYITRHSQPLYKLSLADVPMLPAVTSVDITGAAGHVFDWAVHPTENLLFGGDSSDGQMATLDPGSGERIDRWVTGMPQGCPAYGAAWFNAAGHLMLYCNDGRLVEIDVDLRQVVGPVKTGTGATNNDGASCVP